MENSEILKEKRARLLSDLIEKIKKSIEQNKIKGEVSSKIFIYSRIADFTYYSEVSIRKFLTGIVPKDLTSFLNGIMEYSKLVGIDEEYITWFSKEYTSAANTIIVKQDSKIYTRNNLMPQDLTSIIRPRKLNEFLDKFINSNINISYIYGFSFSGKTKSVMAYVTDIINKNRFENVMWQDMRDSNQVHDIYKLILGFVTEGQASIDESIKKDVCIRFIQKSKTLIVLDFDKSSINEEVFDIVKGLARYTKVIIISSVPYKEHESKLNFYTMSLCANNIMDEQEFEITIRKALYANDIFYNKPDLVHELYEFSGGFPFLAMHIFKKIVEELRLGMTLDEAIKVNLKYDNKDYELMVEKIIKHSWDNLSKLAKKILVVCSKFNYSVACKFVAYICKVEVTNSEWRFAIKELYDNDLMTCIILSNPRFSTNKIVKVLAKLHGNELLNETEFLLGIANYYRTLSFNIGECYNNLEKLKILDDMDEWDVVTEVLQYLEQNEVYKDYIEIVRNLKYYIYVRGMWKIGEESLHLKRARFANKIGNNAEELEGLCDYINICSKSKNRLEAEKYLSVAERIVTEMGEPIDKRIICLYYHVKALYLNNCLKKYEEAYLLWKSNRENYFEYVNEYRKLVNRLWEDRCYIKIEHDRNKAFEVLKESQKNATDKNFTRGITDYNLLIAENRIQELMEFGKEIDYMEANVWLNKASEVLNKNKWDIRNEAFYYRLNAIVCKYRGEEEDKAIYVDKAIKLYEMMNCKKDILFMQEL